MHLFCIKPFHSDNSLWAADKYKFQRLDSCIHEHIGHESPCDISSMVLFEKQSKFESFYNNVYDKDIQFSPTNDVLVTTTRQKMCTP